MTKDKIQFPLIYPIACHTDNVGPGSIFVAIQGQKENGSKYIPLAIHKDARTIVVQRGTLLPPEIQEIITQNNVTLIEVDNPRKELALLSAKKLNFPAKKLKIIAVTGTKGKTTTVFIIEHLLRSIGYKTALLSTVKNKILTHELPTSLTTQHPDYLHVFFDLCVRSGVEYVIMEVAAQAYSLHRIEGIEFDALIFTNFDQEHAEFYPTLDAYFQAKKSIFDHAKIDELCFINADDPWCGKLKNINVNIKTFSFIDNLADFYGSMKSVQQSEFILNNIRIEYPLVGMFNAYNILGALALCSSIGIDLTICSKHLLTLPQISGRMEKYTLSNGAQCFIDYAHNPSSYQALLSAIKPLTNHLIVVFGCGGDRDKIKRPLMGSVAAHYADLIILTSDNPRSEDPQHIIADILSGIPDSLQSNVICQPDRTEAINLACKHSQEGSIILLLGKGPERYQIIGHTKHYFNEIEIVHQFCSQTL